MEIKTRSVIVLRLSGEVCTKSSHTRRQFLDRLILNVRAALEAAEVEYELHDLWFRVDVETRDERAVAILSRVFGVQSVTSCEAVVWETLDEVVALAASRNAARVEGRTFAVRARRAGPRQSIPFTSMDVERAVGTALLEGSAGVDLNRPQVTVSLEVRSDEVFFYEAEHPGPGGLPLGVQGRAVALMSGGFDSAVAAWLMMKRGVELDFLFFNLGGPAHQRSVRKVTQTLVERWNFGYEPKLYIVDFRPVVARLKEDVSGQFWQLLLKRLMMRAGHQLACENHYPAMITGEASGQVSSQTLWNLAAISAHVPTPVFRPLLGFNKDEIIDIARSIGTYDVCAGVPEFCALGGGRPVTKGNADQLSHQEAKIDLAVIERLVNYRRVLGPDELKVDEAESVDIDDVPEDAVVIDLRSASAFRSWSYPDAIHLEFDKAIENFALLPRGRRYLFFCDVGLKSACLAEAMHQMGYEAYNFRGSLKALKRIAHTAKKDGQKSAIDSKAS